MSDCANCPYVDFKKFLDYYGHHDYGDRWVSAAWDRKKTYLENGVADFSKYEKEGRKGGCCYTNKVSVVAS
jgi:hypothetical protein